MLIKAVIDSMGYYKCATGEFLNPRLTRFRVTDSSVGERYRYSARSLTDSSTSDGTRLHLKKPMVKWCLTWAA